MDRSDIKTWRSAAFDMWGPPDEDVHQLFVSCLNEIVYGHDEPRDFASLLTAAYLLSPRSGQVILADLECKWQFDPDTGRCRVDMTYHRM